MKAPENRQIPSPRIFNRQQTRKVNMRLLKRVVDGLLTELKIEKTELEINLICVAEMTSLNETFLRHKGSTDVITFDYSEKQKAENRKQKCLHGEIFICVDEAILQSKKFKTNWQSEIVRYIVHGILHLLGHNDLRRDLRRKMKLEENRLLRELSRRFALSKL
jgi:probable rRNA maturation factor